MPSETTYSHSVSPPNRRIASGHPLGPVLIPCRLARTWEVILWSVSLMTAGMVIVGISAWLVPDSRGVGTHEQLGLAPCVWVQIAGVPCPTCGMTTAFAHAVRGQWMSAIIAQPFGFLLALANGVLIILAARVLLTGHCWRVNWYRIRIGRWVFGIMAILLLSWLIKIVVYVAST